MAYNVIPIMDGVWTIEDGTVRMYLVDGGAGTVERAYWFEDVAIFH